jgi:hypothetical protein
MLIATASERRSSPGNRTLPSTQSNLVADRRPALARRPLSEDHPVPVGHPAPGAPRPQPLAAVRPDHGGRGAADLSLFRMAAPVRVGLVLVPLALLWAAILGLLVS